MDLIPALLMVLGGAFAGALLTTLVSRWLRVLAVALGFRHAGTPPPTNAERRILWVLTVVNPVPWILVVALPWVIYRLITKPPAVGWRWFLGSTVCSFLAIYATTFLVLLRNRHKSTAKQTDDQGNVA